MGGSKQTRTETGTSQLTPYGAALPSLDTIVSGGLDLFKKGIGAGVFGGDRTAGLGSTTQAGLDYMKNNASAGLDTAKAGESFLNTLLGNGGATTATDAATTGLLGVGTPGTGGIATAANRMGDPNNMAANAARALTGGQYALDGSGYADLNAGLAGPTQTQRSLQATADGTYLGGANPYLERQIASTNADALNAVKSSFSSSGRFGSGMFANATADALSRNEGSLRYNDYEAERTRQAQAAQAIDAQTLARTGARQSLYGAENDARSGNAAQLVQGANLASGADAAALQGQQALYGANAANAAQRIGQYTTALGAGQSDRAASMAGLAAVPGVQSSLLQPGRTLSGAGAIQDAARQQELDAERQKFDETQTNPWRALGLLSGTTLPIATGFGTTNTTGVTTQKSNPGLLNSILGGLLGAGGIAADLGKSAPGLMQLGTALFSDERVKEDIAPVGKLDDGQTVYRYRYRGDPTMHVGLIAQEVEGKRPDAVAEGPGGVKMVEYGAATQDAAERAAKKKPTRKSTRGQPDDEEAAREAVAEMIDGMGGSKAERAAVISRLFSNPFVDPRHNTEFELNHLAEGWGR